jgi:probable F420-dependent oxidoreductase
VRTRVVRILPDRGSEGDFYTHTLMTPAFNPGPNPFGPPKVFVAAVGRSMTEVAGEVADGLLVHGFTTERYMREVTVSALERGLAKAGRSRAGYEVGYPAMIVTGGDQDELDTAMAAVKTQLAFYASTPAYRPVLALHGWEDLHTELNALSKRREWTKMADLIDQDVVETFAVVGSPDEIPGRLTARFADMITRVSFYTPYRLERKYLTEILAGFKTCPKNAGPRPRRSTALAADVIGTG